MSVRYTCEKSLLECAVYFNVNMRYHTKLKLASGNAYNCSDRSGTSLKEKMYFFIVI